MIESREGRKVSLPASPSSMGFTEESAVSRSCMASQPVKEHHLSLAALKHYSACHHFTTHHVGVGEDLALFGVEHKGAAGTGALRAHLPWLRIVRVHLAHKHCDVWNIAEQNESSSPSPFHHHSLKDRIATSEHCRRSRTAPYPLTLVAQLLARSLRKRCISAQCLYIRLG